MPTSGIRPRFAPDRNEGTFYSPGADFLAAIGATGTTLGGRVTELTALGVSTVFACVNYIASIVSTLPIELYRVLPSGAREVAVKHPARRLMKLRPNAIMVSSDVRYALAYNQALRGNAYAQLVFDLAKRPVEIYPLKSSNVSMRIGDRGFPEYTVSGGSSQKTIGFDRMLHLRGMSSDGIRGSGPLTLAANLIGLAQTLEDNASLFFKNGSRPGMVYSTPPGINLTEQQKNSLRDQLNTIYGGVENAYKTIVAEGGGKIEMVRSANDVSQFDEIAKRTHQQICQLFMVPPHKVGILDHATFSNIEQQQIQAVQDLFLPWCKRWEEALGGALLSPEEQDSYYFKFNLNGILRGDVVARYASYSTALQNGINSINEVRALEDLDPIEGGDMHVRQLNMADINAQSAPVFTPEQTAAITAMMKSLSEKAA